MCLESTWNVAKELKFYLILINIKVNDHMWLEATLLNDTDLDDFSQCHNFKYHLWGTSLVVQWLRLWTPNAGGAGSIPWQGVRSHMPQLRPGTAK